MDYPPEVLNNLHVINVQHLRSLEQGQDILAHHRTEDGETGDEPPRKKAATDKRDNANEDTSRANKPVRMSLREQSVATYDKLVSDTCDGLIIVCKQHPAALLMFLSKVSQAKDTRMQFYHDIYLVCLPLWSVHSLLSVQRTPVGRLHDHQGVWVRHQRELVRDVAEELPGVARENSSSCSDVRGRRISSNRDYCSEITLYLTSL